MLNNKFFINSKNTRISNAKFEYLSIDYQFVITFAFLEWIKKTII